jgi:hypothetical protein
MAERTLAVRKQESEKCHQLIEHHVQDFQFHYGARVEAAPDRIRTAANRYHLP